MVDFIYFEKSLFATFLPQNKEAEPLFNAIATENDGVMSCLCCRKYSFIKQLEKAGFTVKKAEKTSSKNDEKLLNQLLKD